MFLYQLKEEQKKPFFILAKQLVKVDIAVTPEEELQLELIKSELKIDYDIENPDIYNLSELCKSFSEHHSKIIVIIELINLGYTDQEYRKEERLYIKNIAREFQLSDDTIKNCENWIWKKITLFDDILKF